MNKLNLLTIAFVILFLNSMTLANYTIDANLADWGVTPFDPELWLPDSLTADCNIGDNENNHGSYGYGESYDFEALYFDDDVEYFYFACVTSRDLSGDGDLGIDLNNDAEITGKGQVSNLEYAIRLRDSDYGQIGDIVATPVWSFTWNLQGSPRQATGGTVIGHAQVSILEYDYSLEGNGNTTIFEVAAPRIAFNDVLEQEDPILAHISASCGNDSINLAADVNVATPTRLYIRCDRDHATTPTVNRMIVDDFQRNCRGRLSKIFIWGGWKDNIKGQIDSIHIDIHDVDVLEPNEPGMILWTGDFTPADFSETYFDSDSGWFWDPANNEDPCISSDIELWQYEIGINPYYTFVHDDDPCDPNTYWLGIHVVTQPDSNIPDQNDPLFGWKSSPSHFQNAAVSWSDTYTQWTHLHYPEGHPFELSDPNIIDMAFAIESSDINLPNPIWEQPPIDPNDYIDLPEIPDYNGWGEEARNYPNDVDWDDEWNSITQCHGDINGDSLVDDNDVELIYLAWPSTPEDTNYDARADLDRDRDVDSDDLDILTWWYLQEDPPDCDCAAQNTEEFWKMVADDFAPIDNIPVTSVRWWGSYQNWPHPDPPIGSTPQNWRIGFWSNDESTTMPEQFLPGQLLWDISVDISQIKVTTVGQTGSGQISFMYLVELPDDQQFKPTHHTDSTQDGKFWISIVAQYPQGQYIEFPWCWNTRPKPWQQPAVTFQLTDPMQTSIAVPLTTPPTPLLNSYDMAFELDGDRDQIIKWEQPFVNFWRGFHYFDIRFPGWKLYHDEKSIATEEEFADPNIERIVADDFKCSDEKPITALSWWGSYLNYKYDPANPNLMPEPVPPAYFLLQIFDDIPAGIDQSFSHPNDVIWTYKAYTYTENMVGFDKNPGNTTEPPREAVFRYSIAIPDANQFQQTSDQAIYWLSIVAVYPPQTRNYYWGWTNRKHIFNDYAVAAPEKTNGTWDFHPLSDSMGNGQDMSFVIFSLTSDDLPADIDGDNDVDFYDYSLFAQAWQVLPADPLCDIALPPDGIIDANDLNVIAENWLEGK